MMRVDAPAWTPGLNVDVPEWRDSDAATQEEGNEEPRMLDKQCQAQDEKDDLDSKLQARLLALGLAKPAQGADKKESEICDVDKSELEAKLNAKAMESIAEGKVRHDALDVAFKVRADKSLDEAVLREAMRQNESELHSSTAAAGVSNAMSTQCGLQSSVAMAPAGGMPCVCGMQQSNMVLIMTPQNPWAASSSMTDNAANNMDWSYTGQSSCAHCQHCPWHQHAQNSEEAQRRREAYLRAGPAAYSDVSMAAAAGDTDMYSSDTHSWEEQRRRFEGWVDGSHAGACGCGGGLAARAWEQRQSHLAHQEDWGAGVGHEASAHASTSFASASAASAADTSTNSFRPVWGSPKKVDVGAASSFGFAPAPRTSASEKRPGPCQTCGGSLGLSWENGLKCLNTEGSSGSQGSQEFAALTQQAKARPQTLGDSLIANLADGIIPVRSSAAEAAGGEQAKLGAAGGRGDDLLAGLADNIFHASVSSTASATDLQAETTTEEWSGDSIRAYSADDIVVGGDPTTTNAAGLQAVQRQSRATSFDEERVGDKLLANFAGSSADVSDFSSAAGNSLHSSPLGPLPIVEELQRGDTLGAGPVRKISDIPPPPTTSPPPPPPPLPPTPPLHQRSATGGAVEARLADDDSASSSSPEFESHPEDDEDEEQHNEEEQEDQEEKEQEKELTEDKVEDKQEQVAEKEQHECPQPPEVETKEEEALPQPSEAVASSQPEEPERKKGPSWADIAKKAPPKTADSSRPKTKAKAKLPASRPQPAPKAGAQAAAQQRTAAPH